MHEVYRKPYCKVYTFQMKTTYMYGLGIATGDLQLEKTTVGHLMPSKKGINNKTMLLVGRRLSFCTSRAIVNIKCFDKSPVKIIHVPLYCARCGTLLL